MTRRKLMLVLVLALTAPVPRAVAQKPAPAKPHTAMEQAVALRGAGLKWAPIPVPGFPAGLQIAALVGDFSKPGPYTLRLKFPAGYVFPVHWHPKTENLTVISGRFLLGMGGKADPAKVQAYSPGDYLVAPARMPHYGRVEGETVVQLHGTGPFAINLGTPPGR